MKTPALVRGATAIGVFAAMAVTWTFPLVLHLSSHVPGDGPGDNFMFIWNFWWMRMALSTGQDFFHTTYLFAPVGMDLVLDTHTALPALAGATLLGSAPVIAAQNLIVLTGLFLNGYCTYRLALRATGAYGPSVVAGLIFGGSAYVTAHLAGHFNLIHAWPLPLLALAIGEALDGSVLAGIATGAVLAATAYIDYYYAIFGVCLCACFALLAWRTWSIELLGPSPRLRGLSRALAAAVVVALVAMAIVVTTGGFTTSVGSKRVSMSSTFNLRQALWVLVAAWLWVRWRPVVRSRRQPGWQARRALVALASGVSVSTIFVAPLLWHGVRMILAGDYVTQRYLWRSAPFGVDAATAMLGNPFQSVWGSSIRAVYQRFDIDPIESGGWLGIVPVVLAMWAMWRCRSDRVVRQWVVIAGVFLIWALGSHLVFLRWNTGLILPETILRYVPILSNARIPGRALVLVHLALAVLSAKAIAGLSARVRHPALLVVGVVCLVVIDSIPAPFPLFAPEHPAIYETLRDRPETGSLCELPLGVSDGFGTMGYAGTSTLFFQTIHQRPIVGGAVARLPRSVAAAYQTDPLIAGLLRLSDPANPGNPPPTGEPLPDRAEAAALFKRDGIRFVMVNRNLVSAELAAYVDHVLPLTLIGNDGGRSLFLVEW